MRIAIIGTYPPRRCGIATFTADTEAALRHHGAVVVVVPVGPAETMPPGSCSIERDDRATYRRAAEWINGQGFDAVLVEHEFGIFGGEAGEFVLDLAGALTVPCVVTLHTVLRRFDQAQWAVIRQLSQHAASVTVFTSTARRLVLEQHLAPARSLQVVPHGVPVELYRNHDRVAARAHIGCPPDGPVLSTFGLLSRGKGIETVIRAVARLVDHHPDLTYVVAGRTHPEVERAEGQAYRQELQELAEALGVGDRVSFMDHFLGVEEIATLLAATDVFCTAYRSSDQIVSGALSFALASGCPTVSTPYLYAQDMLADGAGLIVPFDDADAFATAAERLLPGSSQHAEAVAAAHDATQAMSWPAVGLQMLAVLRNANRPVNPLRTSSAVGLPVNLDRRPAAGHLAVLLDDTAVLQHCWMDLPRHEDGYCVDDAGRLLPLAASLARDGIDGPWSVAIPRLLSYLRAAIGESGAMRNFMSWDRRWLDEPYAGDHVGRALWGLGELGRDDGPYAPAALELAARLAPDTAASPFSRTLAYGGLGVAAACDADDRFRPTLEAFHRRLRGWLPTVHDDWGWFEPRLTYDNARVPEALLRVGLRMGDETMVETGERMLRWLEERCRAGGHYRVPGHLGLGEGDNVAWSGDEQPLEVWALADAADAWWAAMSAPEAPAIVERAWSWFLGNNRLGERIGNSDTGACFDALTSHGVNRNCGAESTIAFHRCAATWRHRCAGRDLTDERRELAVVRS